MKILINRVINSYCMYYVFLTDVCAVFAQILDVTSRCTSLPEDSTPVSLQNKAFVPSKAPKRPISEITKEISGPSSYVLFRIADLQRPFDRVCQWA